MTTNESDMLEELEIAKSITEQFFGERVSFNQPLIQTIVLVRQLQRLEKVLQDFNNNLEL
jgi:hypothetical protein